MGVMMKRAVDGDVTVEAEMQIGDGRGIYISLTALRGLGRDLRLIATGAGLMLLIEGTIRTLPL